MADWLHLLKIDLLMRKNCKVLAAACIMLTVLSCQKYDDRVNGYVSTPATSGGTALFRMQLGINPNLKEDTIWTIAYNAIDKPAVITDSLTGFTATASYDASQRISQILTSAGDEAMFSYNINGLLTEINVAWGGHRERFVFSYTNNIVSKKSYYTENGSGRDLVLTKDYLYTVINNNITSIKEYSPSGELLQTQSCSFDIQPNVFKDFSLFSYAMLLEADHLMDAETYFNKNLLVKATITNNARLSEELVNNFTLNNKQVPLKVVTKNESGTYTWTFSYH
jgi:hypothetical protein